jgi:hypothetical protein
MKLELYMIRSDEQFQEHLEKLAEFYRIQKTEITGYDIIDRSKSLEFESPENIISLLYDVSKKIKDLWEQFGNRPNILIDEKIENCRKSLQSVSYDFQVMFEELLKNNEISHT